MKEITGLIQLTRDAVDKGAAAIQEVHESMARTPYGVLKRLPLIAEPAEAVECIQRGITTVVYRSIREVNRLAGDLAVKLAGQWESDEMTSKGSEEGI